MGNLIRQSVHDIRSVGGSREMMNKLAVKEDGLGLEWGNEVVGGNGSSIEIKIR